MGMAQTVTVFDAAERDQYERQGFVIRESLFAADEVQELIQISEQLVEDMIGERRGRRARAGSYVFEPNAELAVMIKWEGDSDIVHGIEPCAHLSPAMKQWANDPRLVGPMQHLCGDPEPSLFTEKLNLKRPFVGGRNPLHQDYPYWTDLTDDPGRFATAMVFLDDATLENGCLQVVAGSHALGLQRMRDDDDEFGNNEMDPSPFLGAPLTPVEVPAGSVLYFGSLLVHMSEQNTSDRERRALLFSYGPHDQRHMSEVLAEEMAPRDAQAAGSPRVASDSSEG